MENASESQTENNPSTSPTSIGRRPKRQLLRAKKKLWATSGREKSSHKFKRTPGFESVIFITSTSFAEAGKYAGFFQTPVGAF